MTVVPITRHGRSASIPKSCATVPADGLATVREGISRAADRLVEAGMPRPPTGGKLLRPRVAEAMAPSLSRGARDESLWLAALATQLAHEASLIHDDVVDGATMRRSVPTMAARHGIGTALVLGDHLLACAYRAATLTGSLRFVDLFTEAVEATVAGEIAQGRSRGRTLDLEEYREIVSRKTGRLFGAAAAAGLAVSGARDVDGTRAAGERIGVLYQMLDDFLDVFGSADTGKPPFQDYRNHVWTWVLCELELNGFDRSVEDVRDALFRADPTDPPILLAIRRLESEAESVLRAVAPLAVDHRRIERLVGSWIERARGALTLEARDDAVTRGRRSARATVPHSAESRVVARARSLGAPAEWPGYFRRHSRSFSFASRLFPPGPRERVTEVYAFCRFTDDLVDQQVATDPAIVEAELSAWSGLAARAYGSPDTGIAVLDRVMGEMARRDVPFAYARDLIEGVRMDVRPTPYGSLDELRVYSYRVASVVGGWLTELFGHNEPWVLDRAFALGHAMQLTNIIRDVGEDLRDGRVYLPLDRLERHGLGPANLRQMASGDASITDGYRELIEALIEDAACDYRLAFEGMPELPRFFQRPVAVAARVYEGIHEGIRRNGYDNLTLRAHTRLPAKLRLGLAGLLELGRARRTRARRGHEAAPPVVGGRAEA